MAQARHAAGILVLVVLCGAEGVEEHLAADEGEQEEADIRSEGADIAADRAAQQTAEERHKELEPPEIKPHPKRVAQGKILQRHPVRDGDRECVH